MHLIFTGELKFQNQSLFYYRQGYSFEMLKNQTISPVLDIQINSSLAEECGDDFSCIFDATVTGNLEMGLASQKINQTSQQIKSDLGSINHNYSVMNSVVMLF